MDIVSVAGNVLFTDAVETVKELAIAAVKARASLYGANLYGANLYGANLYGADLRGADLREASLYGANLRGANLHGANLHGASLYGASLYGANLRGANLHGANLHGASLYGADLREASLYGANLHGANLYGADLREASLREANLREAKNAELVIARLQFIPEEGSFIAWKKCRDGVIVKLWIPEDAKRSHAAERKCRASKAVVLEVIGAEVGVSLHDGVTKYRKGETIIPDSFDENRWNTCSHGVHFYVTRDEAEAHEQ